MPRTLPTGTEAWLARQGANAMPVTLADIQTSDGTQYFWSDYEGYYPTKFLNGTRVQTSGGTATLKYFFNAGAGANGATYNIRMAVKNNGATAFQIGFNYKEGPVIPPGYQMEVIDSVVGNGSTAVQLRFEALSVGDSIDATAANPYVAKASDGVNLIPSNQQNFTGWTTFSGAAVALTQNYDAAPAQLYSGWIKNGFNFTRTRDLSTNTGDLVVQNLSGNTIVRDVSNALDAHEFEGALCIVRLWLPLFDQIMDEFHCSLSEPSPGEDECSFRQLTLLDPSQYFCADDPQGELCTWRYKSAQCGSTGAAATCDFKFTTCSDANHAAQERFNGILAIVPGNIFPQSTHTGGGGDDGNGGGRGIKRIVY